MDLWKHSFRKAFAALVVLTALLSAFLLVLQASENIHDAQTGFSAIEIQESNAQHEFSLPEIRVSMIHGSEGFTLSDLKVQVSDKNE